MATAAAKAIRGSEAQHKLTARMEALSAQLGVEMPPEAVRSPDPELQPILESERQVAFLDAVLAALLAGGAGAGYEALTVAQLTEQAAARGLEVPSKAKKGALIAMLQEDDVTQDEGPTGPTGMTGPTGATAPTPFAGAGEPPAEGTADEEAPPEQRPFEARRGPGRGADQGG